MNYYIHGDAANADQIKAAFEKLGYDTTGWQFNDERGIYYTAERKRIDLACGNFLINLIKTHPDYRELELSVQHKFKVGDWLYHNTCGIHPILVKGYSERQGYKVECIESSYYIQKGVVENEYHLWSIADAKDGDVLFSKAGCPFIFREDIVHAGRHNIMAYCGVDTTGKFTKSSNKICWTYDLPKPATQKQRTLLFKKMQEAGYQWDAGKEELRKIKLHYDIDNFKPKQWVLVRDDDEWEWALTRFSYLSNGSASLFVCINGASFQQCIPFEGNEHLLGTTDMCDEMYINW